MNEVEMFFHLCAIVNLTLEEQDRLNTKFMDESIEFWGEAIPEKIREHQARRWYEMARSN